MNYLELHSITQPAEAPPIREIMANSRLEKIQIEKITLAQSYPFEDYEDFALNDLIEEIKDNGIIMPILLRSVGDGYEVIDGRARFLAAKEVGEEFIDAKIIECGDEAAREMIAYSLRIFQRSLRDMPLSQQARLVTKYYNAVKSQGRRTDLENRMRYGNHVMKYDIEEEFNEACGQKVIQNSRRFDHKCSSSEVREHVAARYGLSGRNLARYLRIDQITDDLKKCLDMDKFCFTAAVELSFLTEKQQNYVAEAIADGARITIKNAGMLKRRSNNKHSTTAESKLTRAKIRRYLLGEIPPEPAKARGIIPEADYNEEKAKESTYERVNIEEYLANRFPKYFPPEGCADFNDDDRLIRNLLNSYTRLKDSLCFLYPNFFTPDIPDRDWIDVIFRVVIAYYYGRDVGAIPPQPQFGL